MGAASAIIIVFITILFPPAGAFMVAGCGADLLINILLTCLGYIPGHIHAFYLEFIYYRNQEAVHMGRIPERAPGIFSNKVQNGGSSITRDRPARGYDDSVTAGAGGAGAGYGAMPAQGGGYQGQLGAQGQGPQGYGTNNAGARY